MLLEKRINNLPVDIKLYILTFTYSPQPLPLLNDIKHFLKSDEIIKKIYYDRWIHEIDYEPEAVINWLDNDLIGYMNENYATMYGYRKKFYNIITRSFCIKKLFEKLCITKMTPHNSRYIRAIVNQYFSKNPKSTVKIIWGLLTEEERDEFIQFQEN